jgi:ABC-type multidrug transport system ATPase subunit
MTTAFVLQAHHLKKYFGPTHAVEDVSLSIRRGEIFGFLGPNGSGKTTTISMILGLMYPTGGEVEIFGERVTPLHNQALRRVGALVGTPALIQAFSARRNLQALSYLFPALPAQRVEQVLEQVGLAGDAHRRAGRFSSGMKQRLGLALALLKQPDLLILDEPTNGMDPAGMQEMRLLLRSLARQGVTVFLSSHLLHEMELTCDSVAVIGRGRILAQGAVGELLGRGAVVRVHTAHPDASAQALRTLAAGQDVREHEAYVEVQGVSSEAVLSLLVAQGLTPQEVSIHHPDLESVFLEMTSRAS